MASLLTPPPDAAVREADEWMAASWTARLFPSAVIDCWRTLMVAYREKRDEAAALRAVQAPRLTGSEELAEALAEISAAGLGAVAEGLRLHIKGLTRRLAEAEARPLIPTGAKVEIHTPPMPESELISHLQRQILDRHKDIHRLREAAELRAAVLKHENEGLASLGEQHEARVRELEAESMTFRTECINLETQRADLEAFKSRVMALARGRCECCGHYNAGCEWPLECCHGESWTPPQAWEVGE
jgi:hypothetical protein